MCIVHGDGNYIHTCGTGNTVIILNDQPGQLQLSHTLTISQCDYQKLHNIANPDTQYIKVKFPIVLSNTRVTASFKN